MENLLASPEQYTPLPYFLPTPGEEKNGVVFREIPTMPRRFLLGSPIRPRVLTGSAGFHPGLAGLTAGILPGMLAAVNVTAPPTEPHQPSLSEVHSSVEIPRQLSFWRRFFAFSGPAYLISVGYMDPGNWATDIA